MTSIPMESYWADLEYLVNIDSGSSQPEGVKRIADFFAGRYAAMGWAACPLHLNDQVGPCLIITNRETEPYDLLLLGHMDTVFPAGTAAERPFCIRGGRAYGPGVNDMKSGCLLMYYALRALQEQQQLGAASICVVMNSDEEIGSVYSRPTIEALAQKARHAFILEPARANGALVNERKGLGRYTVRFRGVAAHAGVDPEKGISAVNEMAHWIIALHRLTDAAAGTNVNVGLAAGGIGANVVADHAEIKVDLRFKTMEEYQRIADKIRELEQNPATPGIRIEVSGKVTRPPMNVSEQTRKLCAMIDAVAEKHGVPISWTATGGGSDGNFTAYQEVPTIDGLGVIGGGSHGAGEYIEIASVEPRFRLLYHSILKVYQAQRR